MALRLTDKRPFKKFFCDRMDVFRLPHPAFKVWMYHYKCEQKDRKSWPSIETIAEDCGLNKKTVVDQRRWLLENGWIERLGERQPTSGKFGVMEFRVKRGTIPNKRVAVRNPINGSPSVPNKRVADRTQQTGQEVDVVLEVDIKQEVEEQDMSLKTKITDKCSAILGTQLNPQLPDWSGVSSLGRQHSHFKVIDAFETWANTRRGEEVRYPLREFLKVSGAYLNGVIDSGDNEELEDLLADLYKAGDRTFTGKYIFVIRDLMKNHGAKEVLAAYSEFLGPLDDFNRSRAVQTFCEGGAKTVIRSRAKEKRILDAAYAEITRVESTSVIVPDEEPLEDIRL